MRHVSFPTPFSFRNSCECAETAPSSDQNDVAHKHNFSPLLQQQFPFILLPTRENKFISHMLHAGNQPKLVSSLLHRGKIQLPWSDIQGLMCPICLYNFSESCSITCHIIPTLNDAPDPFTSAISSSKMLSNFCQLSKILLIQ